MVVQWNRDGETVEQTIWNSRSSDGGRVEHLMVEQWIIWWWNIGRYEVRAVEQRWWNSGTSAGGTVEHMCDEITWDQTSFEEKNASPRHT